MARQMVFSALLAGCGITYGQTTQKQSFPIPEEVIKILQTSCMPCHGDKGGRLPTSRLKLSRWAGYGANKEVEKASLICSEIRKGKMPPKSARTSKPELIPTKEQMDLICQWAESLKPAKKK